jgi:hypothetical protein
MTAKWLDEAGHIHDIKAKSQMKNACALVAHDRIRYVLGIKLHLVPVVARQVHEVNPKLKFWILRLLSATSDSILLIDARSLDRRLRKTDTRTW